MTLGGPPSLLTVDVSEGSGFLLRNPGPTEAVADLPPAAALHPPVPAHVPEKPVDRSTRLEGATIALHDPGELILEMLARLPLVKPGDSAVVIAVFIPLAATKGAVESQRTQKLHDSSSNQKICESIATLTFNS